MLTLRGRRTTTACFYCFHREVYAPGRPKAPVTSVRTGFAPANHG